MTTQPIAWQHLRARVPADWEVTKYTLSAVKGKLDFHTRHGYQATVTWQTCQATPDIQRMMTVFYLKSMNSADKGERQRLKLQHEGANGFDIAFRDPGKPVQASRYLADQKVLIQWLFPSYSSSRLTHTCKPVLDSFQTNHGETKSWRLFGINLDLPSTFEPDLVSALPAATTMVFVNPRRLKITANRWGLPEETLAGRDLAGMFTQLLSRRGCRTTAIQHTTFKGMDAVHVELMQRGEFRMDRMSGRWWRGEGWVWNHLEELRLYAVTQVGPKKAERVDLELAAGGSR